MKPFNSPMELIEWQYINGRPRLYSFTYVFMRTLLYHTKDENGNMVNTAGFRRQCE